MIIQREYGVLRMTDVKKIKNLFHQEQKNVHQISKEISCSWATAKSYIEKGPEDLLEMGKRPNRKSPKKNSKLLDRIQELLKEEKDLKIHRKQRYTARTLFRMMVEENLFNGCERYFRKILKKQRVIVDQQKNKSTSHLELDFPFGKYIQFDHGPLEVELKGERGEAYLFVASVPGYSLRFCQFYKKKSQESWGTFHEEAFKFFGGIPENCIYDNDSVLKNPKTKELTLFSCELIEQYDVKMIFCNKGKGNEKGAVENAVGTCRRLFLAGLPSFKSIEEGNIFLQKKTIEHISSESHYRTNIPLKNYQEQIKEHLFPLKEAHEWGVWNELKVDSLQRVQFQNHFYSVPEKFLGARVKVYITPIHIKIYHDHKIISIHERCFINGEDSLELDHYLDQLEKKPNAIAFSKVVHQQNFPDYLLEIRDRLRLRFGLNRGNKEIIRILKLKRSCSSTDFETAIRLGLSYGGITCLAIESFINQLQLTQSLSHHRLRNLPEKLSGKINFDLSPYAELSKKGGSLC